MEYLTELPPMSPEEIEVMNGFWGWLEKQPKPSPYKPKVTVKIKKSYDVKKLRDIGHRYFDMIWRDIKIMTREDAYSWLAGWLDISPLKSHFSMFDDVRCIKAIEASIQLLNDNRRLDLDLIDSEPTPFFELIIL